MNRVILIGNGFDLAHGMKTSYANFLDWYWEQMGLTILKESSTNIVSDELCSFTLQPSDYYSTWFQYWIGPYRKKDNPFKSWAGKDVVNIAKTDKSLCQFKYKSDFFEQINKYYEKGWVDIENEYYRQLLISLNNEYTFSKYTNNPAILNNELSFIQEKLIVYLKEVQRGISESMVIDEIQQKMKAEFSVQDISVNFKKQFLEARKKFWGSLGKETPYTPQRTFVLNFNYTTLADLYFKEVTHIHGNINEPASVIFGYGDELDEKYKTLVNKNENEYLRNVKSVKYLEHANYRNMLEFIESAPFQIFIMGHSCGNSDRTLLNTLFEHRNCISIKPFYYIKDDGSDNYIELVQNIYRNFTDMKLMRNRVVNKKYCEPLIKKDTTQSTGEESK